MSNFDRSQEQTVKVVKYSPGQSRARESEPAREEARQLRAGSVYACSHSVCSRLFAVAALADPSAPKWEKDF